MNYSQKLQINPAFRAEKFENEILLYAVSTTRGIYLNETAYLIWQMCENGNSIGEIIHFLEETYAEEKEGIAADVQAVVESLLESGALLDDAA